MRLLAISDLHLGYRANREHLTRLTGSKDDWLILGGDVGEGEEHLELAFEHLVPRFGQVIWVPGNHELWTTPADAAKGRAAVSGEAKYRSLVEACRKWGVLTPEDPYPVFEGRRIAPLFIGYDYSFRPDDVPLDAAVSWASESGILCTDEYRLRPAPHATMPAWCEARLAYTEARLIEAGKEAPLVLINHFPLDERLVEFRLIPRFSIWCGTRRTQDWHLRFPVETVVYGHIHRRTTRRLDGVRLENVALGYPRDWLPSEGMARYLRQIVPPPASDWCEPASWTPPPPPAVLLPD